MNELDRRTDLYRSLRDRFQEIAEHHGGVDMSPIKESLIERYVFLESVIRKIEARAAEEVLPEKLIAQWVQANNALTGLGKTIGIKSEKRSDVTLETYVEANS